MTSTDHGQADLWAKADELFARALAVEPEERERLLVAGDVSPDVVARVRRLLALDTKAEGFLEGDGALELTLAGDALAAVTSNARHDLPSGTEVGRYRITGVLGRGGTSTVYRAERADGTFEQEVAIKVVRPDVHPEALARRMRAERQILATLAHPNLAKVFDGGVTEDGRPWLGVELIEGTRIDRWADARRLTIDARVRLFLQVLAAVQHAHRNLVVHRDLKPSNILVTDDGDVKLLDFGVAKLMQPEDGGTALEETRPAEGRWLTPAYAAPEQILGEAVTTATDIHALGVVLYELLTGQRPFTAEGDTTYPLERAICETDPTSPSTAVQRSTSNATDADAVARARSASPAELRKSLGGDLDAIIHRALRKDPERRYASAEAMANDLSRHLGGLPVSARGDAAAYRFGTFVRRHRVSVAAASLLFLTVTASSISLLASRGALVEARATAEAEAEESQAVVDFLADVFRGRNPDVAPSDTVTAAELIEWGEERVENEYLDRPALQARLLTVLGNAWENIGLADRGLELHDRALALRREVFGDTSEEVYASLLNASANRRFARGAGDAALYAREALEVARRLYPADSLAVVPALIEVGQVLVLQGHGDTAVTYLEEARQIQVLRGLEKTPEHLELLLSLGPAQRSAGDLEGAARTYDDVLPLFRVAAPDDRSGLAAHLNNAAYLARVREDFKAADTLYAEALGLVSDVFGPGHPNTIVVTTNRASALVELGRTEAALSLVTALIPEVEQLFGPDHWRVGSIWAVIAGAHVGQDDLEAARSADQRALGIYAAALGEDHFWTIFQAARLEALDRALGRSPEESAFDRAFGLAQTWYDAGGIRADGVARINPLVYRLQSLDQSSLADRLAALLPDAAG